MGRLEQILIGIVVTVVAAVIVYYMMQDENKTVSQETVEDAPPDKRKGPAYMTYNLPWAFAPPIGNVLPSTAHFGVGTPVHSAQPTPFACVCGPEDKP